MTDSLIRIDQLKHIYGPGRIALRNLSLEVSAGEIFGLLGPNGSGKSTLFRILSTFFPPTSGTAVIAGNDVRTAFRSVREKIGVVFQSPSLDGKLSVLENLTHQGLIYGLAGKALKMRCREVLECVGLQERRGESVSVLSGGLKRRAEIAKGLLHRPEILLLDEPATGLDPGARRDLWKHLMDLRREHAMTILVTTHLMEEAEHCGRLAILNEGVLVRAGAPDALKKEIGGDVLVLKTPDPAGLLSGIKESMKLDGLATEEYVQLEHEHAAQLVTQLVETFPGRIESVTFRKPTLEDVFVHHTGHRFRDLREAESEGI